MSLRDIVLPADPEERRRRDRVLAWLFAVLCLVLVVRAGRKDRGALVNNQAFGARFLAGADPYAGEDRLHSPYPPSYVLVCAPLSVLPTTVARVVWILLQCGALFLLQRLLRRRVARLWPEIEPHAPVLFALALLLASRFLLRDMAAGGGNLLYATLAYLGFELAHTGRQRAAAAPIALGLVLKPNLALLLPYYALRRRLRVLLSTAVAAVLFFFLPAVRTGLDAWLALSGRWAADVVTYASLPDLHDSRLVPEGLPHASNAMNQSLREAVFRLVRGPGDSGARDVHLLELTAPAALWIGRGFALALLAVTCAFVQRARGPRAEWLGWLAFLPLALLLSPITWFAHGAALLPLFYALAAVWLAERPRGLGALLLGYYVACDLLSQEVVGRDWRDVLQAVSVFTWGNVALLLVTLALIRRASRGDVERECVPR